MVPPTGRRLTAANRGFPLGTRSGAVGLAGLVAVLAVAIGPTVALAVALVLSTLAVRRRRRLRRSEGRSEARALAAALEILVGELRVGAHPVRGFTIASSEAGVGSASARAVGAALAAVAARARLGADVAAGLRENARRSAAPQYWSRVSVYWQLAAEQGLPMAKLMQTAHKDITDRRRFVDRVDAGLSGARATAMVLAGLPVLGVLLGQLVGARPLGFLLGDGAGVLAAGSTLLCAGIFWSDRILDGVGS
ncbi:MAG: type II secretion system F family protein [Mycobacterium sp.]|nr:type II secretion system F family protein [Mycobacterium sp.]